MTNVERQDLGATAAPNGLEIQRSRGGHVVAVPRRNAGG
jgi:hypothetical protein